MDDQVQADVVDVFAPDAIEAGLDGPDASVEIAAAHTEREVIAPRGQLIELRTGRQKETGVGVDVGVSDRGAFRSFLAHASDAQEIHVEHAPWPDIEDAAERLRPHERPNSQRQKLPVSGNRLNDDLYIGRRVSAASVRDAQCGDRQGGGAWRLGVSVEHLDDAGLEVELGPTASIAERAEVEGDDNRSDRTDGGERRPATPGSERCKHASTVDGCQDGAAGDFTDTRLTGR